MIQAARLGGALCVLGLLGCDSVLSFDETTAYSAAVARWAAVEPSAYAFEIQRSCILCEPMDQGPVLIEVRNGRVRSATSVHHGTALSLNRWRGHTIDDILERIRTHASDYRDGSVDVTFNAAWGYPTSYTAIPGPGVVDGFHSYKIRKFVVRD